MSEAIFIDRVTLTNYKSIGHCSVPLGPLNFLVGPNGSGKSNFLDALRFVADALNGSLDQALRERGGIDEVRRRSSGHPTHFQIAVRFVLPDGLRGRYHFKIGALPNKGFQVTNEECRVATPSGGEAHYHVESGELRASPPELPPPSYRDRLHLGLAAGLPAFRPLFDALSQMGFYNLNPEVIRDAQIPDTGEILRRDGSNLASVLGRIQEEDKQGYEDILALLACIVPGVKRVETKQVGKKEILEFRQKVGRNKNPWYFTADSMSDGTLRALGLLTALHQCTPKGTASMPLVGIEEPENAVHPGAAQVLRDAFNQASRHTQVIATSHSPELLDDKGVSPDSVLAVHIENGETVIGPLKDADKQAVRDRLFTVGELMRSKVFEPAAEAMDEETEGQLSIRMDGH